MALKAFWDQNGIVVQNAECLLLLSFQPAALKVVFMFGQQFKANI